MFLEARCDTPAVFDPVEETLDANPRPPLNGFTVGWRDEQNFLCRGFHWSASHFPLLARFL